MDLMVKMKDLMVMMKMLMKDEEPNVNERRNDVEPQELILLRREPLPKQNEDQDLVSEVLRELLQLQEDQDSLRKEVIDTKTVLDPDMMMQKNLHRDQK